MPDESSVEEKNRLTKEQKTGFVLLLIFAITGLGLGFVQLRNTMLKPFALTSDIPSTLKDEVNDISALRLRDTDHDGLSDYDELYIDGTSPYLYDTFSYGFSDKEVVEKGLPRCANAGRNCMDAGTFIGPTTTITEPTTTDAEAANFDLNKILTDPAQLRKMLLEQGMEKSVLDKISDKELIQMSTQIMSSTTSTIQ